MQTILLSTSTNHNCGDDFIRQGVMELLDIKDNISVIWWNRGYGISNKYENSLNINLKQMDYFIVAGTPEWMYRNEDIYNYCFKHDIPFSMIGVGTSNLFTSTHKKIMKKISQSNLCELALARDELALKTFSDYYFKNIDLILDPAFFIKPITPSPSELINILTWQKIYFGKKHPTLKFDYPIFYFKNRIYSIIGKKKQIKNKEAYDRSMQMIFHSIPEPKQVIIHENHEIDEANRLFGKENVFFSSDYNLIFQKYASAKSVVGSRIHGVVPAIIHGAQVHLIYPSKKAKVLESAKSIFKNYNLQNLDKLVSVSYLKDLTLKEGIEFGIQSHTTKEEHSNFLKIISAERKRTKQLIRKTKVLSEYLNH